ncbi:hypothetical protein Poli38472_006375 [Pythium oligandrum]|uniref:Uncharacterized protein n=1 Tax=Pythium oligandrum TaxID=41045 RepID=A0A8K1C4N2_PYTOL|nr:hypothetical protein Poli38472_006375 [Pythium oligandrum]|eukprot:TMW56365.1 hypothetical protein Poli38472_006375 [Pythium oligandrum]
MTSLADPKRRLKLLLVSDLDGQILRVTTLCEQIVCSHDSDVDAVLVCGGLVSESAPGAYRTGESKAAAEGDMMALISRLETIVCRVLYIPSSNDPPTTRLASPNLTQYSINCHSRTEQLTDGVGVMGENRYTKLLGDGKDPAENWELLLVLRDTSAVTALPAPTFAAVVLTLSMQPIDDASLFDYHHLELIGGPHQSTASKTPVIFPGSLRQGHFTTLELVKSDTDDSWSIHAVHLHDLEFEPEEED